MASSGDGPRYIDPDHAYKLYINHRPEELVDYVDLFPGAAGDDRSNVIKKNAEALLPYIEMVPGEEHTERSQAHQIWADCARRLAQECSLAAPGNVVYENNTTSNPGHYMDSPNSSSYNGMMLNNQVPGSHVLRHTVPLNQGSASSVRIPPASSTQLQENFNDGHYMNTFGASPYAERMPSRKYARIMPRSSCARRMPGSSCARTMPGSSYAGRMPGISYAGIMPNSKYAGIMPSSYMTPLDQSSYSGRMLTSHVFAADSHVVNDPLVLGAMLKQPSSLNSGIPSAMPFLFRANSNDVSNYRPKYAAMLNQTSVSNTRFPAPMFLQTNSNNDSKGMRHAPAPGIIQKEERFVRLSVASLIAPDGTQGFGGVLMRGSKKQFICALCFSILGTKPASVFAAACCEAMRAVDFFNPTAVVLESHLFPLLSKLHEQAEIDALKARVIQVQCRPCVISEKSNGAACQLAMRAPQIGRYHIFRQIPSWLVLN